MIIQGRPYPLDNSDRVYLGVLIPQPGMYTIAINSADGLFSTNEQNIFLEDLQTGNLHDLKAAPYIFNSESGRFDNRFVLRYEEDSTLNTPDFTDTSDVSIIKLQSYIKVTSHTSPIKEIEIYDMAGKLIMKYGSINATIFNISLDKISQGAIVVKAILQNNSIKTKKIIN